jgi:hypothetical protein
MALKRNVQQQNAISLEEMLRCARHFRELGVAPAIDNFLASRDIVFAQSAMLWAETDAYMLGNRHGFAGLIVDAQGHFFEFEVELTLDETAVEKVHQFSDVTAAQNMSEQNCGKGQGFGHQARVVLAMLNNPRQLKLDFPQHIQ